MNAVFRDPLIIQPLLVFAEVEVLEPRPELGQLCRLAQAAQGRLSEALCQQALPGLSAAGARNLLGSLLALELCDNNLALNKLGHYAAQHDEVPLREQGGYCFYLARHAALPGGRIVHLTRLLVDSRDQDFGGLAPLPEPLPSEWQTSLVDESLRFRVREANDQCRRQVALDGHLEWTLDFDADECYLALRASLSKELALSAAKERVDLDLPALLARWTAGAWDAQARRLQVPLSEVPEPAQESFMMDRLIPQLDLADRGRYAKVLLRDVPLAPRDASEALDWAVQRLHRRRAKEPGYLARPEVERLFQQVVSGTPLASFAPQLPALPALLPPDPAVAPWPYWQLQAAEDLWP